MRRKNRGPSGVLYFFQGLEKSGSGVKKKCTKIEWTPLKSAKNRWFLDDENEGIFEKYQKSVDNFNLQFYPKSRKIAEPYENRPTQRGLIIGHWEAGDIGQLDRRFLASSQTISGIELDDFLERVTRFRTQKKFWGLFPENCVQKKFSRTTLT